jgi:hypothetical protein
MSTFYTTIDIEYNKRKPAKAMIMRTLDKHIKKGNRSFNFIWGENCISLDFHPSHLQWYGHGWIKELGGADIAQELNAIRTETKKFLKAHSVSL